MAYLAWQFERKKNSPSSFSINDVRIICQIFDPLLLPLLLSEYKSRIPLTGAWSKKKIPPKFGQGSSVLAVGLCIGCPGLVGRSKREIQTCRVFLGFLHHDVHALFYQYPPFLPLCGHRIWMDPGPSASLPTTKARLSATNLTTSPALFPLLKVC